VRRSDEHDLSAIDLQTKDVRRGFRLRGGFFSDVDLP